MIKRLKKVKKVGELAQEVVVAKAASINSALTPKPEEAPNLSSVPKITDQNITEHREEVLKGARKYIYPLQHSKHKIIRITLSIMVLAVVGFFIYCCLGLYKFYQTNTFVYRATQVIPFPIARTGKQYVDYENYLFELRHYVHYYETQQQINFGGSDKAQLLQFRKQALTNVINDSYIKILAQKNGVSVSNREVSDRINEVREQNRLGSDNKVLADVLKSYWGWSINDFRRSLKSQILAEKVNAKLDAATMARANAALAQLKSGADFSTLAKTVSDDPGAKTTGGDYGINISKDNPNIQPQVTEELFKLKSGEYSGVIAAGATLEIVKVTGSNSANTVTAQHISFNLKSLQTYIDQLEKQEKLKTYVHFK